ERSLEASLRPQRLSDDEYINQDKVKGQLRIVIEAAKARHEPLEHIALYGPPGVGKTSLAGVIAHELGVPIKITSGPAIERAGAPSLPPDLPPRPLQAGGAGTGRAPVRAPPEGGDRSRGGA